MHMTYIFNITRVIDMEQKINVIQDDLLHVQQDTFGCVGRLCLLDVASDTPIQNVSVQKLLGVYVDS
jgi:hypothetical protein